MVDAIAGLLLHLSLDPILGTCFVEKPGRRLDQQAVVAVHKGRKAKLPREDDGAPRKVVEQNRGAIAPIVCLSTLLLPASISSLKFKSSLLQNVPIVRKRLNLLDTHAATHGSCLHGFNHA